MISTSDLTVRTPQGGILLGGITASFVPGKIHVIVGLNGSGKTTLLRTICQLQNPYEGSIQIDGIPARSLRALEAAHKISWTESEHSTNFAYTVEDTILWGRWPHHQGSPSVVDIQTALNAAKLMGIADKLQRPVTTLSLGERKKVHLAKSIASEAPYLIWDEPCGPLDLRSTLDFMDLCKIITANGRTILMSLHDIGMARRFGDFITTLVQGKITWSGPADDKACHSALCDTFNVHLNADCYPI